MKIKKVNLKKLSKNRKPKFKVVMFYGPVAVGKYTVANEFAKQTKYNFFHNHSVYDLVRGLFERDSFSLAYLYETIFFALFKEIAKAKMNVVVTHAYSSGYISKTGLSDLEYMKKTESIIESAGGIIYFVHLTAEPNVLLKRVTGNSRKKFRKLKDPKIMKKVLKEKRWENYLTDSAPVRNNIEINNSNLTPKQVVKKLIEEIGI
ncbi:MAG: hypothetical protein WCS86_00105 [Candidatus Paceibacterota bacterium]